MSSVHGIFRNAAGTDKEHTPECMTLPAAPMFFQVGETQYSLCKSKIVPPVLTVRLSSAINGVPNNRKSWAKAGSTRVDMRRSFRICGGGGG